MSKDKENEKALKLLFDEHVKDENAINFLITIYKTMSVWDDLYDGEDVEPEKINKAFVSLFNDIQLNPFYQSYNNYLHGAMVMLYLKWNVANRYEQQKREIEKAYMLRAEYYSLIQLVVFLLHGIEKADELGTLIWDFYGETLEDLMSEVHNA